jgi:hypothetical protein
MPKALDRRLIRNAAESSLRGRAARAERAIRLVQAVRLLTRALQEAGRMGTPVVAKMANLAIDEAIGLVGEAAVDPTGAVASITEGPLGPR